MNHTKQQLWPKYNYSIYLFYIYYIENHHQFQVSRIIHHWSVPFMIMVPIIYISNTFHFIQSTPIWWWWSTDWIVFFQYTINNLSSLLLTTGSNRLFINQIEKKTWIIIFQLNFLKNVRVCVFYCALNTDSILVFFFVKFHTRVILTFFLLYPTTAHTQMCK